MAHPIVCVEASDYDLLVHADRCRHARGPTRGPSRHLHGKLLNVIAYALTIRRLYIELWREELQREVINALWIFFRVLALRAYPALRENVPDGMGKCLKTLARIDSLPIHDVVEEQMAFI